MSTGSGKKDGRNDDQSVAMNPSSSEMTSKRRLPSNESEAQAEGSLRYALTKLTVVQFMSLVVQTHKFEERGEILARAAAGRKLCDVKKSRIAGKFIPVTKRTARTSKILGMTS